MSEVDSANNINERDVHWAKIIKVGDLTQPKVEAIVSRRRVNFQFNLEETEVDGRERGNRRKFR